MTKVILITGASRGIGAATAKLAAARGYHVCVNYLQNQQAAEQVVAEIRQTGGQATPAQADVTVEAEVVRLFDQAQQLGSLTALVNNAGMLERQSRVEAMTADRLQRVINSNILSCFLCAREAVRRMDAGGAIVNVSSVAARLGAAGEYVDYAASKAAVDTLTIGLAQEVGPRGIRVNGVRPGFIYTDIHASGGEPGRVDRLKANLPLRRGGQPLEVAQAILWLLSEEASYTTGAILEVAGGR